MKNDSLPPFLAKLQELTSTSDEKVSKWSVDGRTYVVMDDLKFNAALKKFFKGTTQTFIRQLHFYGFKKVDLEGRHTWGFHHEEGLFTRDQPDLINEIRRKTKVDPDTQKLASSDEVQNLRNQVSFLQQVIEDLRDNVEKMRNGPKIPADKDTDSIVVPLSSTSKKRRMMSVVKSEKDDTLMDFEEMCQKVVPPSEKSDRSKLEKDPSFSSLMDFEEDIDGFSELFSDLEIESVDEEDYIQAYDNPNLDQAVGAISEATKVKKSDVSKIISFLSKLSVKDQESTSPVVHPLERSDSRSKIIFSGCQTLESLMPLRIQKVGAN